MIAWISTRNSTLSLLVQQLLRLLHLNTFDLLLSLSLKSRISSLVSTLAKISKCRMKSLKTLSTLLPVLPFLRPFQLHLNFFPLTFVPLDSAQNLPLPLDSSIAVHE